MDSGLDQGVGEPAPELLISPPNGPPLSLAGLRGRPVLVSFLSHAA